MLCNTFAMPAPSLTTKRLLLRQWETRDFPLFQEINADPRVMEHFPSPLSKQESDFLAQKIQKELEEKDYGLWAIEVPGVFPFTGFVGLHYQDFPSAFTPCIEIAWRLGYDYWGRGYAKEAAKKAIDYAFKTLKLDLLVAFTTPSNKRSWGLMEKLGMTHDPKDDFYHPKLPKDHPLGFHVLYKLKNPFQ